MAKYVTDEFRNALIKRAYQFCKGETDCSINPEIALAYLDAAEALGADPNQGDITINDIRKEAESILSSVEDKNAFWKDEPQDEGFADQLGNLGIRIAGGLSGYERNEKVGKTLMIAAATAGYNDYDMIGRVAGIYTGTFAFADRDLADLWNQREKSYIAAEKLRAEERRARERYRVPQEQVAKKVPEEQVAEAPESKTIEESETKDYFRVAADALKAEHYQAVIDAIPELKMESEMITDSESKERVISEPEQSSQSKETIVSKLKEFYTLTMTRLNAVFDPEIRDFSKQIKRFSEMSESGEIKSDPYGDLSDVQREQVDGIVRILSGNINGLGFSKDGLSVPNDEKIREFVAIAAGTYSYYADEKFSMNDAIESVAQAINKEFKDDDVLSSMRVSREGIELAKAFAAEVSGIQDVTEVKKTAKEFFRQNLSETGYGAFNMESPERPTSLIKQNGRINIRRDLTVANSSETPTPETPAVTTGRFNPHHRTV